MTLRAGGPRRTSGYANFPANRAPQTGPQVLRWSRLLTESDLLLELSQALVGSRYSLETAKYRNNLAVNLHFRERELHRL